MDLVARRGALGLFASAPFWRALPAWAQAKPLRGIMPIVTTPYMPSGAIDFEDLAREMAFFDRIGCTGAVWPQASSDVDLMTRDERLHGMTVIADACRGTRVASILGVQGADIAQMLDYARHAETLNADAVIAMPPSSPQLQTADGFHAYFAALAGAVHRPVVLQTSIPGFGGAMTPSIELILRLAREFPNLVYVKEESYPLVPRMKEEIRHHDLLKGIFGANGGDGLLYEMRLGLDGEMTGQGAYGDVMVAVFDLYRKGRKIEAADAYAKWLLMKNCEQKIPGTQRYIFVKRGVFKSAAVRPGAVGGMAGTSLAPDAIAEIEMRFAALKPYLRGPEMINRMNRRKALAGGLCLGSGVLAGPGVALAAGKPEIGIPPSVVTQPPRVWGKDAPPNVFPDPDVIVLDDSFNRLIVRYAPITRIGTGFLWTEGPAWSGEGLYLLFSDVQGDTQYRYIWPSGEIVPFRKPSYNSNGNCFDFQGRQLSCQHYFRRVVRWELDGAMTVIADQFEGKSLNAPNDIAAHPDGSIWFTDPGAGASLSEGHPDVAGGPQNPSGLYDPKLGDAGTGIGTAVRRELPPNVYRWDPSGKLEVVVGADKIKGCNGICFSPDYKRVYIIGGGIHVGEVVDGKVVNFRDFTDCMVDGIYCHPDGMRADRAGNIWSSSNTVLGYSGVTVWNPAGKCIGRIRLPESAANVCFGGPKRDHLFICAAQSLFMLKVNIQGAAPG